MNEATEGTQPVSSVPLKPHQVAAIFGVHPSTVQDWADKGRIASFRTPGGQRRFRPEDVEAFLNAEPTEQASA